MRKPEIFKMACLRDIQRLFGSKKPFYAGFGNRITDALSYRSVDVPSSRIFTIDSYGEVKMELLELAGYKSTCVIQPSSPPNISSKLCGIVTYRYIAMNDLVDLTFPPISKQSEPAFTDFNYWRPPISDIGEVPLDLLGPPPSPALSARSDSSTSRLSLLNKVLPRRSSRSSMAMASSDIDYSNYANGSRSRTGSVSPRSISPPPPTIFDEPETKEEEEEEEEEEEVDWEEGKKKKKKMDDHEEKDLLVARQQEHEHDYGDELSGSLPGSFELDSAWDKYGAEAARVRGGLAIKGANKVVGGEARRVGEGEGDEDVEGHEEEDRGSQSGSAGSVEEEDYLPEMDFSSVPVSWSPPPSFFSRLSLTCGVYQYL
jgi:phosphatidate phosphatase LPIN